MGLTQRLRSTDDPLKLLGKEAVRLGSVVSAASVINSVHVISIPEEAVTIAGVLSIGIGGGSGVSD